MTLRLAVPLLAFTALDVAAQAPVPVRALGAPQVTFDGEMTSVFGVRELADGRVVVLDNREKMLRLFDPATRASTRIGREGSGPGEYVMPLQLLAVSADSTFVHDPRNNRYLVLGADGAPVGTVPTLKLQPSAGVTYGIDIRDVDAKGYFYYALPRGLVQGTDGMTPVLRYDRRTQRSDTVAMVGEPSMAPVMNRPAPGAGGGRATTFTSSMAQAFAQRDEWVVAPDGAIGIVRAEPYRVEWHAPGSKPVVGPAVKFTPVKVGEAEKEQWRAEAKARGGPVITTTGADGRTQTQTLPPPEPATWPEVKPAFVSPAVRLAPDGRIWVVRAAAASSKLKTYDVFERTGQLVHQVTMPSAARVVGFGKGAVYVVRQDEDDLLHLEKHALPR